MQNKIGEIRKRIGLSQEGLAKALKVSRQTISAIETGKYNPSLELEFVISDYFGVPVHYWNSNFQLS